MTLIYIMFKAATTYEEICVAIRRSSRADDKRQKSTHSKSEKRNNLFSKIKKMPKIDTLDALVEHEEHDDDYQANANW